MSQRTDRVDELLQQEIGAILAREIADPRIGFATITDVQTTPDLRHARVWVSIIGTDAHRRETLRALQGAMSYVQRELGHRLRLKRIPALHVELDDSAQRGTRVLRLLEELEVGRVPDDLPTGETLPTPVGRIAREGDAPEPDEPSTAGPPASVRGHRPRGGGSAGRHGAGGRERRPGRETRSTDRDGGRQRHDAPVPDGEPPVTREPATGEPGAAPGDGTAPR